ncbi:uncharacterized protein BBA_09575 [Beauveria bassiana ARSEF 2860]|uniref:Uncharacterized protein n=1 Tax=Beauveria bassiana (strain ARSEF 2860) TaxID=655819 RepID=J5JC68_BEAB2|nr:uncharacterized protein BBA_09575 [Beauveria bassiana ARSEF 2860]EJP61496.1 hypothetical protein BBA_09575 [Beauveria bassiana ARSEF 2860]
MHRERQVGAPACTPAEVSAPASRVQLFIASFLRKAFMFALADLLNPPPSQEGRAPEAVMVEADAPANSDPNTANEQILSNDAKSPKHSAQTRKTASLIGSAVSSETESSSLPALPSDVNTLACLSQHELSPGKQPRAGKSISKRTIYYDGREWEYKGYKWVKQGILSLRLMPVGSNEIIELVHERDVQLDNQKGLLELWKGIGRPKPKNRMYQPLRILDETKDEKFELQSTGFDEESYSLEPVSKMWKVAPGLVDEYYDRQTQGEASHAVKHGGRRPVRRPQLPPGPRRKPTHRPQARGGKGPSARRRI